MIKRLVVLVLAITAFAAAYGAVTHAWPFFGRNEYYGYYNNVFDSTGTDVLPRIYDGNTNSIPNYVDTAAELINFINTQFSGTNQQRIGAGFIVDSMLGGGHSYPPTGAQMAQWQSNINYYEANGWISWNLAFSHSYNSFYQGTGGGSNPNDNAFYSNSATSTSITFSGPGGWIRYGIRRQCANPVGTGGFSSMYSQAFTISGYTTVTNATPNPGDTITFSHYVRNQNGPDSTIPKHVWWFAESVPPTPGAGTLAGPTDGGVYGVGQQTNVYNHTFTIPAGTAGGTQYCERVGWDPIDAAGGANGRGTVVCATVQNNFSLTPSVSVTVNGASSSTAEVGDNLTFSYAVTNAGPGPSGSVGCSIYGTEKNGNQATPPPESSSDAGYSPPATGCPRIFNVGNNPVATEPVDSGTLGTSHFGKLICRSFWVAQSGGSGGPLGSIACVQVLSKPYVRVYSGDVSAGSGLAATSGTCTPNTNGTVVGWNRGSAQNYAGAGAQYAVLVMQHIQDFSSTLSGASGAPRPAGLSFANMPVPNTAAGEFGRSLGSLPCILNYYGMKPASATTLSGATVNPNTLASGSYSIVGPITLTATGSIANKVDLYVDGDVLISNGIPYTSGWSVANMPRFRLIVRGNIIIDNDVTSIDGLYVAQRDGASGGTINTCGLTSLGTTLFSPYDATFFDQCDNQKLTVNGALVADSVQLGRTINTLSQSLYNETGSGGRAAEVINYGPIMWISQPSSTTSTSKYDSITTLPPVL